MLTLHLISYRLPFEQRIHTAQSQSSHRAGYWIVLHNHECQRYGLGDIAPWPGFGAGWDSITNFIDAWQYESNHTINNSLLNAIQTTDLLSHIQNIVNHYPKATIRHQKSDVYPTIDSLPTWSAFCNLSHWIHQEFNLPEIQHGIELAVLDLCANMCHVSLAHLLYPITPLTVKTHALIHDVQSARVALEQGYQVLKMKVGLHDHWSEDALNMAKIAAILPPHVDMRLDANRAWSLDDGMHFALTAKVYGIDWIEEPVNASFIYDDQNRIDFSAWHKIYHTQNINIAVDESIRSSQDFDRLLMESEIKCTTLKPMFVGGLIPCIQRAQRAFQKEMKICITHALESAVGRRGAIHLAAVLEALGYSTVGGLGGGLQQDVAPQLTCITGDLILSPAWGLGITTYQLLKLAGKQSHESSQSSLNDLSIFNPKSDEAINLKSQNLNDLTHSQSNKIIKSETKSLPLLHSNPSSEQNLKQSHLSTSSIQELLFQATLKTKVKHTLLHPLQSATIARPQHTALIIENDQQILKHITYAELYQDVVKVASHLHMQGIQSHHKIGLQGKYNEQWIILCLAFNWLGCTIAPIKYNATSYEVELISQSIELHTIYKSDHLPDISHASEYRPAQDWVWDKALFLIHTSGTSQSSSKVELSSKAICMSAFASAIRLGHMPNDCWLACLPLHHVGGLSIFLRCLLYQTTMLLTEPNPSKILRHLHGSATNQQSQVSLCSFTPSILQQIIDQLDTQQLSHLRIILLGGAATPLPLWQKANRMGLPIRLTWGMSEAASQICTQLITADPQQAIPPLPFMQVLAINEVAPLKYESTTTKDSSNFSHRLGSLVLYSPTVAGNYLRTQDYGSLDSQGHVRVLGRMDDLIISGGVNISPIVIENCLQTHPHVKDVVVFKLPHPSWGARPIACLVWHNTHPFDPIVLTQWMKQHLSAYKCPSAWVLCRFIPRTAMGKLQRKRVQQTIQADLSPMIDLLEYPSKNSAKYLSNFHESLQKIYINHNYFRPTQESVSFIASPSKDISPLSTNQTPIIYFSSEDPRAIESEGNT
jgi:o-succinylbenzoate---CoA ligase